MQARINVSRFPYSTLLVALVSLTILVGVTWANYRYVERNPGGNDFLVHWVGTRSLLIDGISPYTDTVALRIQNMAYGRPAKPGEHELRVVYPLYSMFIFLPFALISDFAVARTLWMTFLEIILVFLTFLNLHLTGWRPKTWMKVIILLFSIFGYHGMRPLINGNAVVLVAFFIVASLLAFREGRDELAGIFLSLATIKPHLAILVILYVWLYAISLRRWKVVLWTVVGCGILSAAAMIFIPDWMLQNLWEILRFPKYNPPVTPGEVFSIWLPASGKRLGWMLSGILGLVLLIEWGLSLKKEVHWFLWTACLTLVVSQWIGIPTDPGNFIILSTSLILTFKVWEERWATKGQVLILIWVILLFVGIWVVFLKTVEFNGQPLQSPLMFFPLPAFSLIGLYWVRWWAIRPPRLLIEMLRESQVF